MSTVKQALGSGGHSIEDPADALALLPSLDIALLRRQQQLQAARGKQLSLEVERRTAELLAEKSHLELAIREKQEEYQKVVIEASMKHQQEEGEVKKLQAILERHKQSVKATKLKTSELHRALQEDLSQSEVGVREAAVPERHPERHPEQQRAKARLRRLKAAQGVRRAQAKND
ncbi:GRB10-interacting GYF protein 2-like isoform X3 [Lethenteron reissneri]|nr:GRB10-interacting GYF protein 2-like isoform X3 [Lethenteron reissneri]